MTEASNLWYDRVDKAIRDLNQVLEEHRRALVEQGALRTELRAALFKAQIANRPPATAAFDDASPSRQPLRAAAVAALVLGSASYAQAYDYVDSRGYRHWCHHANCADRKSKVVDENDLAWEPPPGVKWQVVDDPAKSARADKD
jgi:ferric-dicitrate binding protein FerR (iron transport regulator)